MNIKEELHALCMQNIKQKIEEIDSAIAERREAISNETKSSMGDKYETTREMLQQDININLERLNKVKLDLEVLNTINADSALNVAKTGSVVKTSKGNYYLSISAGKLTINGELYYSVSVSSPIGQQLKGKRQGEEFNFNGNNYVIKEVL